MIQSHAARPGPPALDAGYLARLGALLGEAMLAEMLEDGLIELADRLSLLADVRATGDLDGMARLGHDLVGMAGHLGLAALSAAAAEMNRAARAGTAGIGQAAVQAAARRAEAAGREAERALRAHLGKDVPA
jgi:HPt (histidine-containing phosphotransfer) domain-containing protein